MVDRSEGIRARANGHYGSGRGGCCGCCGGSIHTRQWRAWPDCLTFEHSSKHRKTRLLYMASESRLWKPKPIHATTRGGHTKEPREKIHVSWGKQTWCQATYIRSHTGSRAGTHVDGELKLLPFETFWRWQPSWTWKTGRSNGCLSQHSMRYVSLK